MTTPELRDYFAGLAMQVLLEDITKRRGSFLERTQWIKEMPEGAYRIADLLLAERNKNV